MAHLWPFRLHEGQIPIWPIRLNKGQTFGQWGKCLWTTLDSKPMCWSQSLQFSLFSSLWSILQWIYNSLCWNDAQFTCSQQKKYHIKRKIGIGGSRLPPVAWHYSTLPPRAPLGDMQVISRTNSPLVKLESFAHADFYYSGADDTIFCVSFAPTGSPSALLANRRCE